MTSSDNNNEAQISQRPLVGEPAPDFELPSDEGGSTRLSALLGKWVILYFYPRDNTSGCTTEACDFRDRHEDIVGTREAIVLGVSPDSLKSHAHFRDKFTLPFALLSDPDKTVMRRWGAFGEKKMYGKTVMGTIRSTFIINPQGEIAASWKNVRAKGHADKVLARLALLQEA